MKKHVLSTVFSAVVLAVLMMIPATAQAKEAPKLESLSSYGTVNFASISKANAADLEEGAELFDLSEVNGAGSVIIAKNEKDAYIQATKLLKKMDYNTFVAYPWGSAYSIDRTKLYKVMFGQVYEHFFEYRYANGIQYYTSPMSVNYQGKYAIIRWYSDLSKSTVKAKMGKAGSKASSIVKKKIKKSWSAKKKLETIHKIVCQAADYTEDVKYIYSQRELDAYAKSHPYVFTAYGCLINGDCVCQGYAAAFSLIARKAGIQCLGVGGYGNGGSHAWNMVNVGGKVSYIDCTWDDLGGKNYNKAYFMVSASKLGKDHSWVKSNFAKKHFTWAKGL